MNVSTSCTTSDIVQRAKRAASAAQAFSTKCQSRVRLLLLDDSNQINGARLDLFQRQLHGIAWIATISAALTQVAKWAEDIQATGRMHEVDALGLRIGFGEYLSSLLGGIAMSQNEVVRPRELGVVDAANELESIPDVQYFLKHGSTAENRASFVKLLTEGQMLQDAGDVQELEPVRDQIRRFTAERIAPYAQTWHRENRLIPIEVVNAMAELGVFGISIDEKYGGLGLGKLAMCLVTEELSKGWIAAGSLGTRAEIAAELIGGAGTSAQKEIWLPKIASGETIATAVFTEPDVGSDLAKVKTRAQRTAAGWQISGSKTWITHASRSDLMVLMARSISSKTDHQGLSIFLAEKRRGTEEDPFPDEGISGSEIEVLGYRGMREYVLSFDEFQIPADTLLGGVEGEGFKQLMQTFESARIQTAARAIGVGWSAYNLALRYALERKQFGRSIIEFPRVADKIALMAVELLLARELTYFAAREKDGGRRCDVDAGMAKLLSARVAWANADVALQIHGGNGYALEYEISRVLCDARILNIFEGAGEIQAHVIGRGLLAANK